jgi:hypothetical protein
MANRKEAGTDRQAVEYGDQRVERGHGGPDRAAGLKGASRWLGRAEPDLDAAGPEAVQ